MYKSVRGSISPYGIYLGWCRGDSLATECYLCQMLWVSEVALPVILTVHPLEYCIGPLIWPID